MNIKQDSMSSGTAETLQTLSVEEAYRVAQDGEDTICVIARLNGQKAGELVIGLQREHGFLPIKGITVEKDFRRKGIGRALMAWAEHMALANGLKRIYLEAYTHDPSPQALQLLRGWYSKMGYLTKEGLMFKDVIQQKPMNNLHHAEVV